MIEDNLNQSNNPEVMPGVLLFFSRRSGDVKEYAFHLRKKGFSAGLYSVPGGHNEGFETYEDCAIRETGEELGIEIKEEDLKPVHFVYRKGNKKNQPNDRAIRADMCFEIEKWTGEFQNIEPEKHGEIEWFSVNNLPSNIVGYIKQALEDFENDIIYSTYGF